MIQALDIPSGNTCAVVDCLNEAGIQAIMFAEGEKAEKNPEPVIYALQHGLIVGNHSWSHPHFSELSLSEGIREIDRCEAVLTRIHDNCWESDENVVRAFRQIGCHRIAFGSDYPFGNPLSDIRRIQGLELTDAEKNMILGENSYRLYHKEY